MPLQIPVHGWSSQSIQLLTCPFLPDWSTKLLCTTHNCSLSLCIVDIKMGDCPCYHHFHRVTMCYGKLNIRMILLRFSSSTSNHHHSTHLLFFLLEYCAGALSRGETEKDKGRKWYPDRSSDRPSNGQVGRSRPYQTADWSESEFPLDITCKRCKNRSAQPADRWSENWKCWAPATNSRRWNVHRRIKEARDESKWLIFSTIRWCFLYYFDIENILLQFFSLFSGSICWIQEPTSDSLQMETTKMHLIEREKINIHHDCSTLPLSKSPPTKHWRTSTI